MFIVMLGNVSEGLSHFGPFEAHEDALEWAEDCRTQHWEIIELIPVNVKYLVE